MCLLRWSAISSRSHLPTSRRFRSAPAWYQDESVNLKTGLPAARATPRRSWRPSSLPRTLWARSQPTTPGRRRGLPRRSTARLDPLRLSLEAFRARTPVRHRHRPTRPKSPRPSFGPRGQSRRDEHHRRPHLGLRLRLECWGVYSADSELNLRFGSLRGSYRASRHVSSVPEADNFSAAEQRVESNKRGPIGWADPRAGPSIFTRFWDYGSSLSKEGVSGALPPDLVREKLTGY